MYSTKLTVADSSFDESHRSALTDQRNKALEIGRNALLIMIKKGLIHSAKNLTLTSSSTTDSSLTVTFLANLDKDATAHQFVEKFNSPTKAMALSRAVIMTMTGKIDKNILLRQIDDWPFNNARLKLS